MSMNVGSGGGSGEPEVMMDINTTPLIDYHCRKQRGAGL